jgi:hypothetical protein
MGVSWDVAGNYSVQVIAQDDSGVNSSWSPSLIVHVFDQANDSTMPVATIFSPPIASVNQSILFDGSGCFDPDGQIVSYHWDFGDGATDTGVSPIHVYDIPGEYLIILTVVDDQGNSVSTEFLMTIPMGSDVFGLGKDGVDVIAYVWMGGMIGLGGMAVLLAIRYRLNIQLFILRHHMHRVIHVPHGPRIAFFRRKEVHTKKTEKPQLSEKEPIGKHVAVDSRTHHASTLMYNSMVDSPVFQKLAGDVSCIDEFQVESEIDKIIQTHGKRRRFDVDQLVDRVLASRDSKSEVTKISNEVMNIARQVDSVIVNQINQKIDEMID